MLRSLRPAAGPPPDLSKLPALLAPARLLQVPLHRQHLLVLLPLLFPAAPLLQVGLLGLVPHPGMPVGQQ